MVTQLENCLKQVVLYLLLVYGKTQCDQSGASHNRKCELTEIIC